MKKKRRKPELLVPAGSMEPFIAAVENGADAVYVGGRLFNARMNAGNFDDETLLYALDYAHLRGVKVFVTMNTLIYDREMEEALEYAGFLYHAGVDALIVQDLGLGNRIRQMLPDFPLHLSTQATVFDEEGVQTAGQLGYERVVLSRELSLPEIEKVCRETETDIEMFVHGALCICYSGQCQMSRYYGGRSGNRGACAQPCRLPYEGRLDNGSKRSGHLMSPRDLCLIDDLGALIDAGVYSFKIEGRMKSPEYVAVVTRIYRKYIDEYLQNGFYRVSPEDREALMQIFNRGGFTAGYLKGNPGKRLMSESIPKNQGISIGEVVSVRKGSTLVDVRCDRKPEMGDGIEIRSDGRASGKAVSNIISYRKPLGNGVYRIGDFKEPVNRGDRVYRTSSKAQLEEARRSFRRKGEEILGRRRDIRLTLTCFHQILRLTAATVSEPGDHWDSQQPVSVTVESAAYEVDLERGTPAERYRNALMKTGNTPFRVVQLNLKGNFDIRVPASEINALRRSCLAELEETIRFRRELPVDRTSEGRASVNCGREDDRMSRGESPGESPASQFEKMAEKLPTDIHRVPLAELCLEAEERGESLRERWNEYRESQRGENSILPTISNVTKGLEDEILQRHRNEIEELGRKTPILVGNLGWISRLRRAGIRIYGDYGLNALNQDTVCVLAELGAEKYFPSLETLETQDFLEVDDLPLMVSEHDFDFTEIENKARKIRGRVQHPSYSSQSRILPKA